MPNSMPFFELHILPMVRLLDRDHMSWFGNLFDYEFVVANKEEILKRLKGVGEIMPPRSHGGPWPAGWIAVFEEWIAAKCPRLERTKGRYTAQAGANQRITLTAEIDLKTTEDAAWLERLASPADTAEYVVYSRPGKSDGGVVSSVERLGPPPPQAIFVTDSEGRKNVPIMPPTAVA